MTNITVKQLDAITKPGNYSIGGGLYLKVQPTGTKSWLFRYGAGGQKSIGLGRYPDIRLIAAKEKAVEQRRLLIDGIDPKAHKEEKIRLQQSQIMSFKEAAEQYIADRKSTWKNKKHGEQWTNTLSTYAYPVIGHLSCDQIKIEHIEKILAPIWTMKHETASRIRGRIESVIDWARVKFKLTTANPAVLKGNLEHLLPKVIKSSRLRHHPAMPYQQVPSFVAGIHNQDVISAKALIFTILTAARTNEVLGSTWDEIDLEARTWTIPKERMKKGKEHRVPLSQAAINVLNSIPRNEHFNVIFHGAKISKPISNMAMLNFLQGKTGCEEFTVHGFRSSFRDWAGETTNHRREVIEHALAHQLADKTESAYQRGDLFTKRRFLMDDWASFVMGNIPKA